MPGLHGECTPDYTSKYSATPSCSLADMEDFRSKQINVGKRSLRLGHLKTTRHILLLTNYSHLTEMLLNSAK